MYLCKIISSGFKSFADKVTLQLSPHQITGMVGPNGSGKSNIIDGVRWVMGEQSARNLRGDKGTDLIFSGSSSRKSLGMAEVTLVFDNSSLSSFCPPEYRHHQQITLTRRVYRDGSKEALINGQKCRLKDLTAFFESAGMGGRGYAIIQQGQVGQILKAKPQELRQMIEEMAGVLEFRKKKQQSQQSMIKTRDNLHRLLDLMEELAARKEVLHEQARAAHAYEGLQNNIRQHQLLLLAYDLKAARERRQQCSADTQKLADDLLLCTKDLAAQEHERERGLEQLSSMESSISSLQEQITLLRERMAACESSLSHLDALQHQHKDQEGELVGALQADRGALLEYREQLAHKVQEHKEALVLSEREQGVLKSFEERKRDGEVQQRALELKMKNARQELEEHRKHLLTTGLTAEHVQNNLKQQSEELSTLASAVEEAEHQLQKQTIDGESYRMRCQRQKAALEQEKQQWSHVVQRCRQVEQRKEQLLQFKEELMCSQASMNSRKKMLGELIEQRQRCLDHLREALKLAVDDSQPLMLMADGVALKEEASELTEDALGALDYWLKGLAFLHPTSVQKALTYFDQLMGCSSEAVDGGMVLGAVQAPLNLSSEPSATEEPSATKKLLADRAQSSSSSSAHQHLLPCYPRYLKLHRPALSHTVGRIYYCPGSIQGLSEKDLVDKVVIFASGVLVAYGKTIIWPGLSEAEKTTFHYSRELTVVEDSLLQWQEKWQKLNKDEAELHAEFQQLEEQRVARQSAVQQGQYQLSEELAQLRSFEVELERSHQEVARRKERLDHLQNQMQDLQQRLDKLREQRQKSLIQEPQLQDAVEEGQKHLAELQQQLSQQQQKYEQSRLVHTSAHSKAQVLEKNAQELRLYVSDLEQRCRKKEERLLQRRDDVKKSVGMRQELQEEIATILHQRSEKEGIFKQMQESHHKRREQLAQLEEKVAQLRSSRAALKFQQEQNQSHLEESSRIIQQISQEVRERYHREPDDLPIEELPQDFQREEYVQKIQSWQNRLEDLGAINFVAQQEYDALEERERFLTEQKQELDEALAVLLQAIAESEQMAREKFQRTFQQLSEEFAEIFPILFPGGAAELVLVVGEFSQQAVEEAGSSEEEESDVERSEDSSAAEQEKGVEIMVQLPGKRRGSLNLFSGGEKALTAIALIFSFLKTKPTPFCLLDEVDAPLDEVNVGRYNALLMALQERFQFLVITHNRKTMEVFDVLYGITMQEPGVSKVVGVDLEQSLPAHLKKKGGVSLSLGSASRSVAEVGSLR